MTGVLQQLLDFAVAHPSIVGLIVLLSAAAEAIVVVGAFFPGTSIVLALAGVAGAAHTNVWLLTLWAATGAVIGDGVSFWIGHRYGAGLQGIWPFRGRPELLARGSGFFEGHGGKSVFFARFLPGVRAVVPVAAGMLGMNLARFYTANIASAVVWAISHVLLAAGIGVAFVTLGNMSGRLALLAGIALIVALVLLWLVRLTVRWLAPTAAFAYEGLVARLGQRPDPISRRLARILDPAQPRIAAVALWSAVLVVAGIGFLGVLEDLVAGDPLVRADAAVNHLVQSIRTPFGDSIMVVTTSLGDTVVTGGLVLLVIAWLSLRRAFATAGAVALTMGVSVVFVFAVKAVLHKPRPIDIYAGADAFSFPSGHTTMATVLYGIVAVLISKSLPRSAQIAVFTGAGIIAGAIGFSRIYLSAHWPSDVLGGVLFGAAMTAAFALIFERLPAERIGRAGLAAITVTAFVVLGTWHASESFSANVARYAVQPIQTSLSVATWNSSGWQNFPASRTDLAGETEEPLIVQWAGDPTQLAAILTRAGWLAARPWSARDALQFLNPAATLDSMPPLPLLNDGRLPALTMIRAMPSSDKQRLVFRAWPTQTVLSAGAIRAALFVGAITFEEMTHPFSLMTTLHDRKPPNSAILTFASALRADKTVNTIMPTGGNRKVAPVLALPVGSPLGTANESGPTSPGTLKASPGFSNPPGLRP